MTAAGPLVFPGSRVLAGWWQQLAPGNPQALWVGHLLLHRIEAMVWTNRPRPLDRFAQLVLQSLTLSQERTVFALEQLLRLHPPILRQVLHRLQKEGLAQHSSSNEWQLTTLGRHALERSEYPSISHERRRFAFVQSTDLGRDPAFLNLNDTGCVPWPAPEDWSFDAALLQVCVGRPVEWKRRWGFPLEVEGILPQTSTDSANSHSEARSVAEEKSPTREQPEVAVPLPFPTPIAEPPEWRRVILDRPERLLAVLVQTPAAELFGYSVRADGWDLRAEKPAFQLSADWHEVFPELAIEPSLETWRQVWREWCRASSFPATEVDGCSLERSGYRLRVKTPKALLERIKIKRREALAGEVWLQAGEERIRPAAQIELAGVVG